MKNAALVLADEFEGIRSTGQLGGEALLSKRVAAHEFTDPAEYFTFLTENAFQVPRILDRVKASGQWHRGFGVLRDECMNVVFMFQSGWGGAQQTGPGRVALHTIHNLESLGNTFNNLFREKQLTESQRKRIKAELEGVRQFVLENSDPGKDQTFIFASIDHILRMLDDDFVDHAALSSEISSLLGLLVMYASTFVPEEERGTWFERVRTGALILVGQLAVTTASDLGSLGMQKYLGIE